MRRAAMTLSRQSRVLAVAAALAALLSTPAGAGAATARVAPEQIRGGEVVQYMVSLVDSGNEANRVTVVTTRETVVFRDESSPIVATEGCTARSPSEVECAIPVRTGVPTRIRVEGGGSDDSLAFVGDQPVASLGQALGYELRGGDGNDTLQGGAIGEGLHGGPGEDRIVAGGGADVLLGGPGRDTLAGEAGNDRIVGGADRDSIAAGDGDDTISFDDAGRSGDNFECGVGRDRIERPRPTDRPPRDCEVADFPRFLLETARVQTQRGAIGLQTQCVFGGSSCRVEVRLYRLGSRRRAADLRGEGSIALRPGRTGVLRIRLNGAGRRDEARGRPFTLVVAGRPVRGFVLAGA